MQRDKTPQILPRHTSEQRLAPELHGQLTEELKAEIRRRNKERTIPMPRFELIHRPAESEKRVPAFILTYHAASPSAALHVARRLAEKLDIVCDFHDKYTDQWLFLSHLAQDDL